MGMMEKMPAKDRVEDAIEVDEGRGEKEERNSER
jgi:hypothetical protein